MKERKEQSRAELHLVCSPAHASLPWETKQNNPGWQRPSLPTSWAWPTGLRGKAQVRMHKRYYTNSAGTTLAEHKYEEQAKA